MLDSKRKRITKKGLRFACSIAISQLSIFSALAGHILPGHVPDAARNLQPKGKPNPEAELNLAIGLPLRNPEALTNLLDQLCDPASPNYRQFLTPDQFAAQFGPSQDDYDQVVNFSKANGLEVTATHSNRMLVSVSGKVKDIERAFHVSLATFKHPEENRDFFAPQNDPELDLAVSVLHISGLDNFALPKPAHVKKSTVATPSPANQSTTTTDPAPQRGTGPSGSFIGKDFRNAYASGVTLNGAGQAVGLLQFDGYYPQDITQYATQAGLTNIPLQNVLLDKFNGSPGTDNDEVALDIEMAMSMAPGLSKIIVYEAGPYGLGDDILNRMATDNAAKQISASWTYGTDATTSQIFQQLAAQGQSYFNASGDSDAYVGAVDHPADNPYVTVVGGTTLSTSTAGAWSAETAWNWGGDVGTGGGFSSTYNIPSWQQGISMTANGGSTARRNLPDVAMIADNVFVISSNGQQAYMGGTSVASPLWAGFMALVNQQAVAYGKPTIGFINPAIYTLGKGATYSTVFHDIVTGNNTNTTSPNNFYAVTGYDLCTGWGTPKGAALINALVPPNAVTPFALAKSSVMPNRNFVFSFPTISGHTYTVEYSDTFLGGAWTTLTTLSGTGTTLSVTNSTTTKPQRFFRVRSS